MPKNKELRVVIDTNLWISFLISHRQDRLDNLLVIDGVRILFSTELLDEINITITRPKLKKYFGIDALDEMLLAIEEYVNIIDVKSIVSGCRDTKDNFLLALAKDGNADFLLTGDKDLLELKKSGKTKIVTITHFLGEINIHGR